MSVLAEHGERDLFFPRKNYDFAPAYFTPEFMVTQKMTLWKIPESHNSLVWLFIFPFN